MAETVLVAGGAGYIGSHVCKALYHSGFVPVSFDNLSRGHEEAVQWGALVKADLSDRKAIRKTLDRYSPKGVIHLANFAYVAESIERPLLYFQNNVADTVTFLDELVKAGITKFVFSSSCATYGIPQTIPIPEDHPQHPINPYGSTKLMVESILHQISQACDMRAINLRYFNAAGADPDGSVGESHDPETHVIPLVLKTVVGEQKELSIYGADHPTPDGTCIRDFVHVSDLADAHVGAMKYLEKNHGVESFNLGTGKGTSIRELVTAVEQVTGGNVPTKMMDARQGDPPILVGNPQMAKTKLGWVPRYREMQEIVNHAWSWCSKKKY